MSKVISFHGADHKCGCTQVALSMAFCLSRDNPEKQIVFVSASCEPGDLYLRYIDMNIDRLKPYISKGLFIKEDVIEYSKYKGNLSIIGGPSIARNREGVHPDSASFLIKKLAEIFDYVICDCGAEIENGLSFGAMLASDEIFIVISQSECCLRKYEWLASLYERLKLSIKCLLLNKYQTSSSYDYNYILERLGMDKSQILKIRYTGCGERAEVESQALWNLNSGNFKTDILSLSQLLYE